MTDIEWGESEDGSLRRIRSRIGIQKQCTREACGIETQRCVRIIPTTELTHANVDQVGLTRAMLPSTQDKQGTPHNIKHTWAVPFPKTNLAETSVYEVDLTKTYIVQSPSRDTSDAQTWTLIRRADG